MAYKPYKRKKLNNIDDLDREIIRLKWRRKKLGNLLDENTDDLKDNFLRMSLNSVTGFGPKNPSWFGSTLNNVLDSDSVKDGFKMLFDSVKNKIMSLIDGFKEKNFKQ
ncbi:hypothetical protein [Gynurincola endophyticus]|jgi:hypothetical protein|uniref:hypothetical protein n=1 Tax=Gynurincola endophyticus TaxID=2479004 RepID=UPI000F8D6A32|nr:hypothetical protein [Gynurincola endophyticus]